MLCSSQRLGATAGRQREGWGPQSDRVVPHKRPPEQHGSFALLPYLLQTLNNQLYALRYFPLGE